MIACIHAETRLLQNADWISRRTTPVNRARDARMSRREAACSLLSMFYFAPAEVPTHRYYYRNIIWNAGPTESEFVACAALGRARNISGAPLTPHVKPCHHKR